MFIEKVVPFLIYSSLTDKTLPMSTYFFLAYSVIQKICHRSEILLDYSHVGISDSPS